ncbi:MAG: CAP domain-containing protein [Sandaracinaceae bacterium]
MRSEEHAVRGVSAAPDTSSTRARISKARWACRAWLLLVMCAAPACTGTLELREPDGGFGTAVDGAFGTDASLADAETGLPDAGPVDAGSTDAGSVDAGSVDAGSTDAGSADSGPIDAGPADAATDGGPPTGCPTGCPEGERCAGAMCVCEPDRTRILGVCLPSPTAPASHPREAVCNRYRDTTNFEGTVHVPGAGGMCDPGSTTRAALEAALGRTNFYRWLTGLYPVALSPEANRVSQACAVIHAWSPIGSDSSYTPHDPRAPRFSCITADGHRGAMEGNIGFGPQSPAEASDGFIYDYGNDWGLGHRRHLLNPRLWTVGYGLFHGGPSSPPSSFGGAVCMNVTDARPDLPAPEFVAYPPPGFFPAELLTRELAPQLAWSIGGEGLGDASVTVRSLPTGDALPITMLDFLPGFPFPLATRAWRPNGWTPAAGETYEVTVRAGARTLRYEVRPVDC